MAAFGKVLILGGTSEGSALARMLAGRAGFAAVLSLAGVTRAPVAVAGVATRVGGFGGAAGLAAFLRDGGFDAVVDATHPYAVAITPNAVAAAALAGVAHLRVARPAWHPGVGDRWTMVGDVAAAAACLGPVRRRVLLTVGRKELGPFRDASWHDYLVRSVDAPAAGALPGARVIAARGPFALGGELTLLRSEGIEVLVTKNSGGGATAAKLEAARLLGVGVVMVERPGAEQAGVADAAGALAWLEEARLGTAQARKGPPAL